MKKILLACFCLIAATIAIAQKNETDTIQIGQILILKKKECKNDTTIEWKEIIIDSSYSKKNRRVKTNWFVFDIGFSDIYDQTNYAQAISAGDLSPSISNKSFLRTKSNFASNFTIWLYLQKIKLAGNVLSLKHGLGIEKNEYSFANKSVKFNQNPTYVDLSYSNLAKNKLKTRYVTIPVLININLTPKNKRTIELSGGMSVGYLIRSHQYTKHDDKKAKSDVELNKWKIAYQAELKLYPVTFYGSMATKSMFNNSIDFTPYNIGMRWMVKSF